MRREGKRLGQRTNAKVGYCYTCDEIKRNGYQWGDPRDVCSKADHAFRSRKAMFCSGKHCGSGCHACGVERQAESHAEKIRRRAALHSDVLHATLEFKVDAGGLSLMPDSADRYDSDDAASDEEEVRMYWQCHGCGQVNAGPRCLHECAGCGAFDSCAACLDSLEQGTGLCAGCAQHHAPEPEQLTGATDGGIGSCGAPTGLVLGDYIVGGAMKAAIAAAEAARDGGWTMMAIAASDASSAVSSTDEYVLLEDDDCADEYVLVDMEDMS